VRTSSLLRQATARASLYVSFPEPFLFQSQLQPLGSEMDDPTGVDIPQARCPRRLLREVADGTNRQLTGLPG
jgi:hypothetical protein